MSEYPLLSQLFFSILCLNIIRFNNNGALRHNCDQKVHPRLERKLVAKSQNQSNLLCSAVLWEEDNFLKLTSG